MDLDVEDVVWAKMRGYPYWPARITEEASSGSFKKGIGSSTRIHVEFLGGDWDPKWIPQSLLRKFEAEDTGPNRKRDFRASARWELSHLAAIKIGLDRLLQKGGLTIKTEPKQDQEFSPAQDSLTTQQDMGITQEKSDDKVPMSKELSLCKNEAGSQREDSQFYTPEQEFTLASPDQQFFTPSLNLSVPSQAKLQVNPREGRSGIKFSPEQTRLESDQWSSTPGTTKHGLLLPGKGRLNSSEQKKTMKNKQKSVDTTWRRRSMRQSMTPCAREEPDLVSSPQLDVDWKVPYKCRLCRTKFGWTADRDSHELICEGEVQNNAGRDSHELICEGEVQGTVEYGVNCEVISPTERQVAKNDDSAILSPKAIKGDSTTASESTADDDLTTANKFATTANGKDDSQTGSKLIIKGLANESCFNVKLSMAENIEVEFGQPSDNQKNLQFIGNNFEDMELEPDLYVGNYAEVEWSTEDSGLEANDHLDEGMEKVFGEEACSRQGIIESSACTEESMDMEANEGNNAANTSVNTGLKRRIDLQDGDKYDLIIKRRRLSGIEPASLVRKDMNANKTDDYKLDKNLNNASHDSVSPFYNLVIDEDCSSEETLLVNAKTIDSYENNDNSQTIDENSFHGNPPINSEVDSLVSSDQSSIDSRVRSDNSRNFLKSTNVAPSVERVSFKLTGSSDESSHLGSHVETFQWNDKVFPEKDTPFDSPISSTKSYPKINSLKDEKKISPKYENCILPPKVKTKAELKDYGYSRIIEKSNASNLFVCLFVKCLAVPHPPVQGSFLICAAPSYTKGSNRSTSVKPKVPPIPILPLGRSKLAPSNNLASLCVDMCSVGTRPQKSGPKSLLTEFFGGHVHVVFYFLLSKLCTWTLVCLDCIITQIDRFF